MKCLLLLTLLLTFQKVFQDKTLWLGPNFNSEVGSA